MVDKVEKSPLLKVHPLPWQHYIFEQYMCYLYYFCIKMIQFKPETNKTKYQPMGISPFAGVLFISFKTECTLQHIWKKTQHPVICNESLLKEKFCFTKP